MGLYDKTIGTLLVGTFFNTFLYGLVIFQFAVYYVTKFNDSPTTRCMVLFLFLVDTFHSASAIYMVWSYVVTNYDNPAILLVADWPHTLTPLATALAALATHGYLGLRIWRLTGNTILYSIIILLAILSFALGTACSIEAWRIQVLSELRQTTPIAASWLSMQVVVDMLITVPMVIILSNSRTGRDQTDSILNRFIRGAIRTGLFSGIFSVANLIVFVVLPETNLFAMFGIPHGRIYTNTLLDILLARKLLMVETDSARTLTQTMRFDSVFWPPTDSQAIPTIQRETTTIQSKV